MASSGLQRNTASDVCANPYLPISVMLDCENSASMITVLFGSWRFLALASIGGKDEDYFVIRSWLIDDC
jgi:hypothetical protein